MKLRGIRVQLLVIVVTTLFFTALLISAVNVVRFDRVYKEALEIRSVAVAQNLREAIYRFLDFFELQDFVEMNEYIDSFLASYEDITYGYVTDHEWRVLYHNDTEQVGQLLDRQVYATTLFITAGDYKTLAIGPYYESVIPILVDGEVIGAVHVGMERNVVAAKITPFVFQSVGITFLITVISIFPLYLLLSRNFARPLTELTLSALQIASGDMQTQVRVDVKNEIGELARAFNSMVQQLQTSFGELEERVNERTANLERRSDYLKTSANVGHAAALAADSKLLLQEIVEVIQAGFDLYHVGLFRIEENSSWVVLRASAGAAAKTLLEEKIRFEAGGRSMVGWCAANAQARIVPDVREDEFYFVSESLSGTRSAVALPLIARGLIIGVLSFHSEKLDFFDADLLTVMQTISDQVAITIDNANLLQTTRDALDAERKAHGDMGVDSWLDLLHSRKEWGYTYDGAVLSNVEDKWLPEMEKAKLSGQNVVHEDVSGNTLSVPIKERDRVVGVLNFQKEEDAATWSDDEIAVLDELAEQLSVALASARSYQETQQRALSERITAEATAKIRQTLDLETMLKTAAQEIRQALGLPEVTVSLMQIALNEEEAHKERPYED